MTGAAWSSMMYPSPKPAIAARLIISVLLNASYPSTRTRTSWPSLSSSQA